MIYCFEEFALDTDRFELRRDGAPLHIEPQVYSVLRYLIEQRARLVGRDELLDAVWGHRFVTPATLNTRIKSLRQALGDDGSTQRFIRTVRGRGFRFVGDVAIQAAGAAPARAAAQTIRFCHSRDGVRIAYATSGVGPPLVRPASFASPAIACWNVSYSWDSWVIGSSVEER